MLNRLKTIIKNNNGVIGCYGIERETLRVDEKGVLSTKPHPENLGDKFKNPFITTDFSESQIEIITPAFSNIMDTYNFVNLLYDTVAVNIGEELLWPQSMPSIIQEEIPVADFGDEEGGIAATRYRERLMKKYGGKKQLISGVHFNFSFDENIIKGLYEKVKEQEDYKTFKNNLYLKVTRNYLKYRWLLIYLLGSTSTIHESFKDSCECTRCFKEIAAESYAHEGGISIRNGECGYRNLVPLNPDYSSVEGYVKSLKAFVKEGLIDSHKELYSQIRLKPADAKNFFQSLLNDGIKYLEYRTIDVNPFVRGGVALVDLKFLESFNLYLLLKEEVEYEKWQEEALENQELIAKFGKRNVRLKRNGEYVLKAQWAMEILEETKAISKELSLNNEEALNVMIERVQDVNKTYAHLIEERVKNKGFVGADLTLAELYKEEAIKASDKDYYINNQKISSSDILKGKNIF